MKRKTIFITALAILIIFLVLIFSKQQSQTQFPPQPSDFKTEIVAENLNIPWEIEFLPNSEILVTERPGNLVRIGEDRKIIEIEGVQHRGEGGLLGLALHPNFEQNNLIYIYLTSSLNGKIENRVERYNLNLEQNVLENKEVILSGIPGASNHDGGRIEFSPDGYLFITTGDAGKSGNSQDLDSLAGKILRIDEDGNPIADNPFNNEVYSYGHRNPQGLAWDEQGNLWATEHGRSGLQSGFDELNLIEIGKNYGWPEIQGDEEKENMVSPIIHSGSSETWAPAGTAHYNGNIFFTGLRGETLYQYNLNTKELTKHLEGEFGRLRAITLHENFLYISTSNTDGRGRPKEGDDKIIRIDLIQFS